MYQKMSPLHNKRYSELFQTLEHTNIEFFGRALREGTFVKRTINNRQYWYFKKMTKGQIEYVFVGPDTVNLNNYVGQVKETKPILIQQVRDLVQSGGYQFRGTAAGILSSLSDAGIFAAGTVLVGTNAFLAYQNMLGIKWVAPKETLSTLDVDFAQSQRLSLGVPLNVSEPVQKTLLKLNAKPTWRSLTQTGKPWIYQIQEGATTFDIEFLTPLVGPEPKKSSTVSLPWLGVGAQPIRFMDYLVENSVRGAVALERGAILVNLPDPGRFALHKLIVAERRSPESLLKKKKDRLQSGAMIEFLSKETPEILDLAWADLVRLHPSWARLVQESAKKLPEQAIALDWTKKMFSADPKTLHFVR